MLDVSMFSWILITEWLICARNRIIHIILNWKYTGGTCLCELSRNDRCLDTNNWTKYFINLMIHSCRSNAFYCFYFTHLAWQLSSKINDKHTKNWKRPNYGDIQNLICNCESRRSFCENYTRQALGIQFFF